MCVRGARSLNVYFSLFLFSVQAEVDISALAQALMYNTWFESVRLSDANLPDAARALACTFEVTYRRL